MLIALTLHQQRRPFLSALFSKATPLPSTPLLYHTFFVLSIISPLFYCHFIATLPLITLFRTTSHGRQISGFLALNRYK
nr:MAG TPA: hypothetical protein [Caudoviricetes sp.]